MTMRALLITLFAAVFIALIGLFSLGLKGNPKALDLVIKGQKIPTFQLPLLNKETRLTDKQLSTDGNYYLINFWGSWCPACLQEQDFLIMLAKTETLYGVNWKDTSEKATLFLRNSGNPYKSVLQDAHSELAIGLGVYGAPETFLIAKDGTIIFRYAGALNETIWQTQFIPYIQQLNSSEHIK